MSGANAATAATGNTATAPVTNAVAQAANAVQAALQPAGVPAWVVPTIAGVLGVLLIVVIVLVIVLAVRLSRSKKKEQRTAADRETLEYDDDEQRVPSVYARAPARPQYAAAPARTQYEPAPPPDSSSQYGPVSSNANVKERIMGPLPPKTEPTSAAPTPYGAMPRQP